MPDVTTQRVLALQRCKRLRHLARMQRAQLDAAIEDYSAAHKERLRAEDLLRTVTVGGRFRLEVDPSGRAVRVEARGTRVPDGDAQMGGTTQWSTTEHRTLAPEHDNLARLVHQARTKLAEAEALRDELSPLSSAFARVAEAAEAFLADRGWSAPEIRPSTVVDGVRV